MKIIHTADWHLGKKLHGEDFEEDHKLFFEFLVQTIKKEKVTLLIISGDLFDLANPSSETRKLYYNTLLAISQSPCAIIITGGNHDAPNVLNAPKKLLESLNITVVGGLPQDWDEMVIPFPSPQAPELIITAIPFIKDSELKNIAKESGFKNKEEAIKKGLSIVYQTMAQSCRERYPGIPVIATGHLFASGVTMSDSEREIQIGNLASFDANLFDPYFKYIALGHIHQPQQVGPYAHIRYSGAPVSLSFSERNTQKELLLIDSANFQISTVPIPSNRTLIKIEGDLHEIRKALETFQKPLTPLTTLLELELKEKHKDESKIHAFSECYDTFNKEQGHAKVVETKMQFEDIITGTASMYEEMISIDDLRPIDIFYKRIEKDELSEEDQNLLQEAFQEILQMILQDEDSAPL